MSAKERAEKGGVSQPEEKEIKKLTFPLTIIGLPKWCGNLNKVEYVFFDCEDCILPCLAPDETMRSVKPFSYSDKLNSSEK